jgi:hypothetical protein
VAHHVRSVLPSNRAQLPAVINMHSVKNRWLLRIKNITPDLYRRHWFAITLRDLAVLTGCLLREWRSLRAFTLVAGMWRRTWDKRRLIMQKRRAGVADWFAYTPVSYPAPAITAALAQREKTLTR